MTGTNSYDKWYNSHNKRYYEAYQPIPYRSQLSGVLTGYSQEYSYRSRRRGSAATPLISGTAPPPVAATPHVACAKPPQRRVLQAASPRGAAMCATAGAVPVVVQPSACGTAARCHWECSPVPVVAACAPQVLPAGANLSTRAASWSSREEAHVSYAIISDARVVRLL